VSQAATAIGRESETLRVEVDQFLTAVHDDGAERRGHERTAGKGASVELRASGQDRLRLVLEDISRGGASLRCARTFAAGSRVEIDLPASGGPIPATVVRSDGKTTALVFPNDAAILSRIDRTLDALNGLAAAA
jgi:methyl-accepting chemotaxis protein